MMTIFAIPFLVGIGAALSAFISSIATALNISWAAAAVLVVSGTVGVITLSVISFKKVFEIIQQKWKENKDASYTRIIKANPIKKEEIVHVITMKDNGEIVSGTTIKGTQLDQEMKNLPKNTVVKREK